MNHQKLGNCELNCNFLMKESTDYSIYKKGDEKLIALLVEEHMGWATAIAKSVARAWKMDWQLDGLDGGAYEALLFCAGRYDPSQGVPFKGYARRRIHEASTEQARKSKLWQHGTGGDNPEEQEAREISAQLFEIFPELREGLLPKNAEDLEDARISIKQMLVSASIISAFNESGSENPEIAIDYKRLAEIISEFEPIHQHIVYELYWNGNSMRGIAAEWGIDDVSIVREHKGILEHLALQLETRNNRKKLEVRRALQKAVVKLKKSGESAPFSRFVEHVMGAILILLLIK